MRRGQRMKLLYPVIYLQVEPEVLLQLHHKAFS